MERINSRSNDTIIIDRRVDPLWIRFYLLLLLLCFLNTSIGNQVTFTYKGAPDNYTVTTTKVYVTVAGSVSCLGWTGGGTAATGR
jgi:hypothetical protein